jgi:hypothetical protein
LSSCSHDSVPFPSSTSFFFFISLFIVIQSFDDICSLDSQVFWGAKLRRWPSGSKCETKNTFL